MTPGLLGRWPVLRWNKILTLVLSLILKSWSSGCRLTLLLNKSISASWCETWGIMFPICTCGRISYPSPWPGCCCWVLRMS